MIRNTEKKHFDFMKGLILSCIELGNQISIIYGFVKISEAVFIQPKNVFKGSLLLRLPLIIHFLI